MVLIITFTTSIYGQIDQGDEIFSANGGDQPVIDSVQTNFRAFCIIERRFLKVH